MKIPTTVAESVVTGSMKELWSTFINLDGEYAEYGEDYEKVRYGIKVHFEIQDLWEETVRLKRRDKEGKVMINRKIYTLEEFRTEKEERRKIMVNAIMENLDNKTPIKPRGEK